MSTIYIKDTFIDKSYVVVSKKEASGNISNYDYVINDYYFNEKNFESAEIKMQRLCLDNLLNRKIKLVISGDLYNQIAISTYSLKEYKLNHLGLYGACSTFVESLIVASKFIEDYKNIICITSSHSLNSEKQFRFPIEYGSIKKMLNTITATGSVGCIVTNKKTDIKIESFTIGNIIDSKIMDPNNMGAVMALSAYDTIKIHLKDTKRKLNYYDLILTGDLGKYGSMILKELFNNKLNNHIDSGAYLYKENQNMKAGGSGPACLPIVLFDFLKNSKYKKILIVGTGSLHTPVLVNQKCSIPTISHAVSLEVL